MEKGISSSSWLSQASERVLLEVLASIREPGFFSTERVAAMVRYLPRGRLSKFQPLLPPELEAPFVAERLFDIVGLQDWLADLSL
jgi:ATP-dependent Lhr-like helicase